MKVQKDKFSWSNISMENYAAIMALTKHTPTDLMAHNISMMSLCTGKPESFYEEMAMIKLEQEIDEMMSFLSKEPQEKYVPSFTCDGRKFKVTIDKDQAMFRNVRDVSALGLNQDNFAEHAPKIVAAFCEETTILKKKLSLEQRVDLFTKQLPASIGIGTALFFWEVSKELSKSSLAYLEREGQRLMKEMTSR